MAGVFRDGFDTYNGTGGGPTGLGSKWTVSGSPSLVGGAYGGQALRLSATASAESAQASLTSSVSAFMVNFGLRINTFPTTGYGNIRFLSGATYMLGIGVNTDGSVVAYRQTASTTATSLGSSAAGIISAGNWYAIEAIFTIHDTTGAVTIKVDGATVLTLTNVDTRNGAPTTVNSIHLFATSGGPYSIDYDDIYITDSAAFLSSAVRIETLVPNADGGTLNWTPSTGTSHYAVVDELPVSSTDYLSASSVGDLDILDLTALSSTPTSIEEVCISGFLNKTDAAARTVYLGVDSGGTISDGSAFTLNSTGVKHERPLATDPNTSAAWTASAVNALKVRPKVAS